MNNTFEFIGKISIGKESDKFKPFEENTGVTGWTNTKLLFNLQTGVNRHMLQVKGFHKADGTGTVYSLTRNSINPDTKEKIKGEPIQIAWADRLKQKNIEQIAEFKKFVIDLEEPNRRYNLEKAIERIQDGSITDEELEVLKVTKENIEKELIDSKKKKIEFIHETDFAKAIHKLIDSGKYLEKQFKVSGEIIHTEYNGKFYKQFVPSRIYLSSDNATQISEGLLDFFFTKDAVDVGTNRIIIKGYVGNYDSKRKGNLYAPVNVVLDSSKDETDSKRAKLHKLLLSQFNVDDDSYKELGLKVDLLNGSQKIEIKPEMLNDFQKEMLELEAITMDDIRKELGGDLYGKKVEAIIITGLARGYSKGRKDTVYKTSDFVPKPLEIKDKKAEEIKDNPKEEEEGDIFSEFI